MKKLLVISICSLFFISGAPNAFAGSQHELSLNELCQKSDDIVIVEVISSQSYMVTNRIFTEINLQVVQSIKGKLNIFETITMTILGGTINGITTLVLDSPNFKLGEQSLLFLSKVTMSNNKVNYLVTGMSQGKFNIFFDAKTNIKKVNREQIAIALKTEKNTAPLLLTDVTAMPLTDFIIEIKRFLK